MVNYELNLRDYLRIIRKRKLIIVASAIIFTAISFLYISGEAPVYESSTTVKIEERKTIAGLLTEWIVYNPGDVLETQTKVIKSAPVIEIAARKMGLISDELEDGEKITQIVANLQGRIRTERVGQTNILKIIAVASKPQEARDIAHYVREAYITYNLLEKNKQARTVREFIENQLSTIEARLEFAEDKLEEFNEELAEIKISQGIQQKLVQLEFEKGSLIQKYTQKHPLVFRLNDQIEELKEQIGSFANNNLEYIRLQREVEVNRKIYATLREKLEEVRIQEAEKVSDVSRVDPPLIPKNPTNIQSKTGIMLGGLLGLIIGMVLSFITESLDASVGTIDDVEDLMQLPVLGVVPSVHKEDIDSLTFFQRLKRRFLFNKGRDGDRRYARLVSHYKPTSPVAESFRNIKANIKFSPLRKVLMLTSAGPQEGKTTILINLGLVCAQEGLKTLIISSDLRRPAVSETFGFDKKPGLSDIIIGTATFEESLRGTSDMILGDLNIESVLSHPGLDHLWILPSGITSSNPLEILDSKEFDELLIKFKNDFDIILFDSPPVLPVADASILSPRVDGVILCYEIGRTSRHALLRTKIQLESAGANILGIVLNHIQPETESIDTYPYYYKYKYRYYGKEDNSNSRKKNQRK